jgi:hypothetical protein
MSGPQRREPVIRAYASFEDMLQDIKQGEADAQAAATPGQNAIAWGDFFERNWLGLRIYGRISTLKEFRETERGLGASLAEIRYEEAGLKDAYSRGYRYGRCFSVAEPEGEVGSTHVVTMRKITEAEFNEAKNRGWA